MIDAAAPNAFPKQTARCRDGNHYYLVMYDVVFRIGRRRASDGAALAGLRRATGRAACGDVRDASARADAKITHATSAEAASPYPLNRYRCRSLA
jgi:hypothetical protein